MMKKSILISFLFPILALFFVPVAQAAMTLDNAQSTVSFVSVKKGKVGEVHTFSDLSGSLSDDGKLNISIALDSVQTGIEIRNTRMREMLFETVKFPTAKLNAQVNNTMSSGKIMTVEVPAMLSLHGASKELTINATAVKVGDQLLVSSNKPVIVNANDFGLVSGIEALRNIAKLSSIPISVPVSFTLVFK